MTAVMTCRPSSSGGGPAAGTEPAGPAPGAGGAVGQGSDWATAGMGTTSTEDPGTRAKATCTAPGGGTWRDFASVTQTAVNQRYANPDPDPNKLFRAVGNFKPEEPGAPADSQDSGQKAINYKTEPLWFRLAQFPPNIPLRDMRNFQQAMVYSNAQIGGLDPETPVFTAAAASPVRMHFAEPGGGSNRHHGFKIHGHLWQRSPYFAPAHFDNHVLGILEGTTRVGNNPISRACANCCCNCSFSRRNRVSSSTG